MSRPLFTESHLLILTVRDDGIGMPESAPHSACLGLKTMRHRADTIGATLEAGRHPGGGSVVTCSLPLRAGGRPC